MIFLEKLFIILFKTKFIFKKPQKKDVLIYDKNSSEFILKYIKLRKVSILDTRFETINLYILLQSIVKNKFKNLFLSYVVQYIKSVDPKVVLTLTDTDLRFYQIKNKIKPIVKVISIQNGQIGSRNYFELAKKEKNKKKLKLSCDYIFVANKKIVNRYKSIIKSNFAVIGSFKNNSIKVNNIQKKYFDNSKKKKIIFLSQFNPPKKKMSENFFQHKNFNVTFNDFYSDDTKILNLINEFCENNKIKLFIKLRHKDKNFSLKERNFFKKNLNFKKIHFIKKTKNKQSYETLDASEITTFIDSFMGYESFARGNKVVSFSVRAKNIKIINSNFADNFLPSTGFFWTNKKNRKSVYKILNNVLKTNYYSWQKIKKKYEDKVMIYDKDNKIFKNLINKILKEKVT